MKIIIIVAILATTAVWPPFILVVLGAGLLVLGLPFGMWMMDPHREDMSIGRFLKGVWTGQVFSGMLSSMEDFLMPAHPERRDSSTRMRIGVDQADKLTPEVMEFVEATLAGDPTLATMDLASRVYEKYKIQVTVHSLDRALRQSRDKGAEPEPPEDG